MAASFRFRLDRLLDVRRAARDRRRAELAEALHAARLLEEQRRATSQEREQAAGASRQAAQPGPLDVDFLAAGRRRLLLLDAQQRLLAEQQGRVEAEIEQRRLRLVEADQEVRVLEKLRQRKADEHERRELARDTARLDEAAAVGWRRGEERA